MKKVTMKDVAAAAGVSVAAVSRVMNGCGYVAPDKREAILQAISTVGYRAQRVPPGPQTPLIGLILRSANGLPYFSQLSEALMSEASAKGFNTMLFYCDSMDNDTLLKRLETFQNYNISGLVVGGFGPNALRDDVCMYLRAANVPVVLLERSPECRGVNRVLIDNESGMYTAARYLLDQGHKEIVYLNRDLDSDVEKDRLHGFLRAMQAAPDVKYWVNNGKTSSPRTAFTALEQLKQAHPGITAVLTWGDIYAAGALQYLYQQNLRVPQDVEVVTCGDTLVPYLAPAISSVAVPLREMARTAVAIINDQLADGQKDFVKTVTLEPLFTRRGV